MKYKFKVGDKVKFRLISKKEYTRDFDKFYILNYDLHMMVYNKYKNITFIVKHVEDTGCIMLDTNIREYPASVHHYKKFEKVYDFKDKIKFIKELIK